jgi:hypothetical protein
VVPAPILVVLLASFYLAYLPSLSVAQQGSFRIPPGWLHLSAERVVLSCWPGQVLVEGLYVFQNLRRATVAATVCFPVAVDEEQAFPYECEVEGHEFWTSVSDTAIFWAMQVRPAGAETVRVRYLQEMRGKKVRYILRTTQAWPVPVGEAEFVVVLPASWQGVELSPRPDSTWLEGERRFHRVRRKELCTDVDLVIRWQ